MAKFYNLNSIETGDFTIDVELEADGGYDGIGSYEYWGQKCFDKGHWDLNVEDIKPRFTDEPQELRDKINKYIDDNFQMLADKFAENWDYPEPREPGE